MADDKLDAARRQAEEALAYNVRNPVVLGQAIRALLAATEPDVTSQGVDWEERATNLTHVVSVLETERDRFRERLDQFEAHGFPNVAAVLDRGNAPDAVASSIVRSDSPPARPLPTCANCGSNFIVPALDARGGGQ